MTTKYGMFKEHVYLKPGDAGPPGGDATAGAGAEGTMGGTGSPGRTGGHSDRDGGLNFKATVSKAGKGNDATFDKFKSLHEGDRFVDPSRRALQQANESRKAQVVQGPFKQASPMKASTTPGDFTGTFEGRVEHVHSGDGLTNRKLKGEIPGQPRGFYTSPAKKGGFGYNKTTLSERQGFKGVATEYEYQHEPDELQRQRRVAEREAHRAAMQPQPFKPANPPKRGGAGVPNTTISKGKGVAGEYEYILAANVKADGQGAANAAATEEGGGSGTEGPAFKPASLNPRLLGKQPEYLHDPEVPKIEAEHARRKAEATRLANSGAWRPNQGPKTDMVRSIVRMNLK